MIIQRVKNKISREYNRLQVDYNTKAVLSRKWKEVFGYQLDWNNPKDLNEKIQWLIVNSDTSKWTRLTDKILVRNYVKEKGLGDMLVPLLGTWDNARKIDFDKLPDKFVLKCNHDSGSVKIIDKKKGFDKSAVVEDLNNHLRVKFGYLSCEPHYNKIKPLVLAEEFLDFNRSATQHNTTQHNTTQHNTTQHNTTSLTDYKFFCANGEPYLCWVCNDRFNAAGTVDTECRDLQWNYHPEYSRFTSHYVDGGGNTPCPRSFEKMLQAARILSEGFPQVRVDFYDIGGKAYFGEMTFTSVCGRMSFFTKEFLLWAGEKVDLRLAPRKRSFL